MSTTESNRTTFARSAVTLTVALAATAVCVPVLRYWGTISTPVALGWGGTVVLAGIIAWLLTRRSVLGAWALCIQTALLAVLPVASLLAEGWPEWFPKAAPSAGPWVLLFGGHLFALAPLLRADSGAGLNGPGSNRLALTRGLPGLCLVFASDVVAFRLATDFLDSRMRWGVVREDGAVLLPPVYASLSGFDVREQVSIVDGAGRARRVDISGRTVVAFEQQWESVRDFESATEELLAVERDEKYGFADTQGRIRVPPIYTSIASPTTKCDRIMVAVDGRWGYLDAQGRSVVLPRFEEASPFECRSGLAAVMQGGRWGFVDRQGAIVIPFRFEQAQMFHPNAELAPVREGGRWGFVNRQGKVVIPFRYDEVSEFRTRGDLARVTLGGRQGCVDTRGREVVPVVHDEVKLQRTGSLVAVRDGRRWGFVDSVGRTVVEPFYNAIDIENAAGGWVAVSSFDRWGVVAENGREIVPLDYQDVRVNGAPGPDMVRVRSGFSWGLLKIGGDFVIPPRYDELGDFGEQGQPAPFKRGGLWGYVDATGREIVPPRYDRADAFRRRDGLGRVGRGDGDGLVDVTGREVIPPVHADLGSAARTDNGIVVPFAVSCWEWPFARWCMP